MATSAVITHSTRRIIEKGQSLVVWNHHRTCNLCTRGSELLLLSATMWAINVPNLYFPYAELPRCSPNLDFALLPTNPRRSRPCSCVIARLVCREERTPGDCFQGFQDPCHRHTSNELSCPHFGRIVTCTDEARIRSACHVDVRSQDKLDHLAVQDMGEEDVQVR